MANTIWKYLLDVDDTNDIEMPIGAELLKVDMQHGSVCIWVKVDDSLEKEKRTFKIYGTGHLIPDYPKDELVYIDTFQTMNGYLVFHVFELLNHK